MSTAPKKLQMSGAEVLVKTLEARGTKYVFGIPGAKIDAVFDTLADSTIQTVVCRHEQNAAFIAGVASGVGAAMNVRPGLIHKIASTRVTVC